MTAITNAYQLGSSGTAANNLTLQVPASPDGTGKLARGNAGATTQDILTIGADNSLTVVKAARGAIVAANSGAFDLSTGNFFSCTPTGGITLSFSNLSGAQSGTIILNNTANYTVSKSANVKVSGTFLNTVSFTGLYMVSFFSDGTNIYIGTTGALA